jgi:methyl-accepting chemotaxis protein
MAWFHNLRISSKLLVAFGVLLGFTTALGLFALACMDDMRGASDEVSADRLPSILPLVSVLFCFFVARSISRPLARAVGVAERIAGGDLGVRIGETAWDETGRLLASLRHMVHRLAEVIGEVREGANALASASSQLATSSQSLAQTTSEQASASTAEALSSQAEALLRLVSFFHLWEGSEQLAHLPPRAPIVGTRYGQERAA